LFDGFNQETGDEITPIWDGNNLYAMDLDAKKLLKDWREENRTYS